MSYSYNNKSQVWSDAEAWLKSIHLVREKYHGNYEGNECRTILKNTAKLGNMVKDDCILNDKYVSFKINAYIIFVILNILTGH